MLKKILPYFSYLKPVWFKFFLGIAFGIVYSVASGLGLPVMVEEVFPILFGNISESPVWLRNIADTYFEGAVDGGFLLVCCLAIPAVVLIRAIGFVGNGYYMAYAGISVIQSIQIDVYKKVQSLPLSFFNKYKTGEINAAVMGYPNQIKGAVVDTSNDLVIQPLTLISAIAFLIYKSFDNQSFFMAVIGIASAPFIIFLIRRIGAYLAMRSKQIVALSEELGSSVIENFQSPIEIRAYNLESKQISDFMTKLRELFKLNLKSTRVSLIMSPSIEFISGLGIAFALFFGVRNGMGEGDFFALIIALYMIYTPIKRISAIQNKLKILEAPIDRLEAILNTEVAIRSPENPKPISRPFEEQITFENVDFRYENGKTALKNANVTIPFGKKVGLVGESGAGKSTFANLLLRLYDPNKGRILFGEIDIRELNIQELRELISYVPQSPILFNNTILENIRVGNPNASEEAIMNAAKQANAHKFISELEHGYQTTITERGNSLSGGQRQRISIARAFLKNSPILILDEATSSLDNKADKEIKDSLKNLCEGRTSLIIAHRLSSLEDISKRMVFQNGQIIGYGEHEDLLSSCDHYKEIIENPNTLS
jgi:subfamily B ATP-binding cassette protein MsbA